MRLFAVFGLLEVENRKTKPASTGQMTEREFRIANMAAAHKEEKEKKKKKTGKGRK